MFLEKLSHPVAYYHETLYLYKRTRRSTRSYFGGPSDTRVSGLIHGPRALHHIMTIKEQAVPPIADGFFSTIRLLYGMCYDGSVLKYEISDHGDCRVLEMTSCESTPD